MKRIVRLARALCAGKVSEPAVGSKHHLTVTRTANRAPVVRHSRIRGMEETEIEQVIIQTLQGLDHPRIREVEAFRDISGSERTGVRVTDSDGSRGFIQVVD